MYFPQAGDVALTLDTGVTSKMLRTAQIVALDKRARFSHALICLGSDLWCEAIPISGVHISTTAESFLNHQGQQASLYRPPPLFKLNLDRETINSQFGTAASAVEALAKIEIEAAAARKLTVDALYYVGQKYNFLYLLAKPLRDERKFCSELVVRIMLDLKVPPFDKLLYRRPSAYTPVHIQTELARSDWQCLDDDFAEYLRNYSEPQSPLTPDETRSLLINTMLIGTNEIIFQYKVHATGIRYGILLLGLLRRLSRKSRTAALTQQRESLQEKITKGEKYLKETERAGSIQRGAPWMGGNEQRQKLIAAKEEIEESLRQATAVLRKRRPGLWLLSIAQRWGALRKSRPF